MPLIYCFRNHSFPFHITWIHITDTKVYSECTFIQELPVPESISVQLLSSGHFSIPATHPLFWHPVLLPFSLPADMIHCNSGFLLFPEQCSLSHFPDPCMSYDGTEKEPAKRIKIKRSLVIFPFCRLLIVFCYIQLVYKLLRRDIYFRKILIIRQILMY